MANLSPVSGTHNDIIACINVLGGNACFLYVPFPFFSSHSILFVSIRLVVLLAFFLLVLTFFSTVISSRCACLQVSLYASKRDQLTRMLTLT